MQRTARAPAQKGERGRFSVSKKPSRDFNQPPLKSLEKIVRLFHEETQTDYAIGVVWLRADTIVETHLCGLDTPADILKSIERVSLNISTPSKNGRATLCKIYLVGPESDLFYWAVSHANELIKTRKILLGREICMKQVYLLFPNGVPASIMPLFEKEEDGASV